MNRTCPRRSLASLALALTLGCEATPPSKPAAAGASASSSVAPSAATAPTPAAPTLAPPVPVGSLPLAPPRDEATRVHVRADGQLGPGNNTLFIDLVAPAGAKLTADSPVSVRGSGGIGLTFPSRLSGPLGSHSMPLRLPIEVADGATGPAQVEVSYYWCTDGNDAACQREQASINVELDLSGAGAGGEAHLSYRARGDRT